MAVDNQSWAINGRFLTQPMTGVQRYAFEISAALDAILAEEGDLSRRLPIRLVLPPGAKAPALAKIGVERMSFGSGQLWDQLFLPMHARAGLLRSRKFRTNPKEAADRLHSRRKRFHSTGKLFVAIWFGLSHITSTDWQTSREDSDGVPVFKRHVGQIQRLQSGEDFCCRQRT